MRGPEEPGRTAYGLLSRQRAQLMGLAMLWVMLFHAYNFSFGVLPLDAVTKAGFAGVDVFILLSAMGLYVSLQKAGTGRSLGSFYSRRALRVLPAYWLVVGIYSLALAAAGRISLGTAVWSLTTLHYWFHIPGAFNWYIPALLAFYLLTPFYVRVFDRCPHKEWLTAAMFPLAYGLYRLTIPLGLNYTEDFVNRLPAYALGILAGHYVLTERPLSRRHALVWALGCLAGGTVLVLRVRHVLYISPCYIIAVGLMPLCLVAAWAAERWGGRLRPVLAALGQASLEIYLINVIVTREFDTLSPWLDVGPRHAVYYAAVCCANLALGLGLHRAMEAVRRRFRRGRVPSGIS